MKRRTFFAALTACGVAPGEGFAAPTRPLEPVGCGFPAFPFSRSLLALADPMATLLPYYNFRNNDRGPDWAYNAHGVATGNMWRPLYPWEKP